MNLNAFKNNKLIFIALLILVGLFIFFLFKDEGSNPDSPAPVIDINGTKQDDSLLETVYQNPNVKNQNYTMANLNINNTNIEKTTAPIYKYQPSNLYTKENLLKLIEALDMEILKTSQSPVQGEVIMAKGSNSFITIESDLRKFDLAFDTPTIQEGLTFKDRNIDEYVQIAKAELLRVGFDLERYPTITYSLQRTNAPSRYVVNFPEAADFIEVIFSASIDDSPFIDSKPSLDANKLTVLMDVNKNISRITGEDVGSKGEVLRTASLKNLDQVREEIYQNKAKLISASFIVTGDISAITVTNIKLGYYTVKNEIIPVYLIKGLTRTGYYSGEVDLLLTAETGTN